MKRMYLMAVILMAAFFPIHAQTAPEAVFMGDSIFELWGKTDPAFFTDNHFVNKGISGQVSAQMLARFQTDVLDLKPGKVVILAGTNDIARNSGEYVSIETIRDNIAKMAVMADKKGIQVIICSVLPCRYYRWRPKLHPEGEIIRLNALLRDFAQLSGYTYVDFHSKMADAFNGLPETLSKDGCHPVKAGYEIMKKQLLPVAGASQK